MFEWPNEKAWKGAEKGQKIDGTVEEVEGRLNLREQEIFDKWSKNDKIQGLFSEMRDERDKSLDRAGFSLLVGMAGAAIAAYGIPNGLEDSVALMKDSYLFDVSDFLVRISAAGTSLVSASKMLEQFRYAYEKGVEIRDMTA